MRYGKLIFVGSLLLGSTTHAAELSGKAVYDGTCVACHGPDGKGAIPGAPNFTEKNGPLAKPDGLLKKHILEGFQSTGSPMAMPPKGGNPSLTGADIDNVLRYLRSRFKR